MLLRRHVVVIQHGDMPRRSELCPLRGCIVDMDGFTTCQHVACPACGVGPPVSMPNGLALCEQCGFVWDPIPANSGGNE